MVSSYPNSMFCSSLHQKSDHLSSVVKEANCRLMRHLTKVIPVNLWKEPLHKLLLLYTITLQMRHHVPIVHNLTLNKSTPNYIGPLKLSSEFQQINCAETNTVHWVARATHTSSILSPATNLPSFAAAPLGLTVVTKMPGSEPTWTLSVPPRMLNPKPAGSTVETEVCETSECN